MKTMQRLNTLNREAMQASNEGRTDDALFKLIQAGRMAKALVLPLQEAAIRNNMGIVHQAAGNLDEARACFRVAGRIVGDEDLRDGLVLKTIAANLGKLESAGRRQAA